VGKWVYPGSNEKRDDVLAALDDKAAGVDLHISVGDSVVSGQPLCTVHADAPGDLSYALDYAAANRTL
jgi:thymidine phosphorylase